MNIFPYKIKINSKHKYCCYLTIYKGKKLPPFYIGSSSVIKINKDYHGTIRSKKYKNIYDLEIKENPHLFNTIILRTTINRKRALGIELFIQKKNNVVKSSFFLNMAFAVKNGFFGMDMTGKNNSFYGKTHSNEAKLKNSNAHKGSKRSKESCEKQSKTISGKGNHQYGKTGKNSPLFGKKMSEETRKKLSKALSGIKRTQEQKNHQSITQKGRIWMKTKNNTKEKYIKNHEEKIYYESLGWIRGRLTKRSKSI